MLPQGERPHERPCPKGTRRDGVAFHSGRNPLPSLRWQLSLCLRETSHCDSGFSGAGIDWHWFLDARGIFVPRQRRVPTILGTMLSALLIDAQREREVEGAVSSSIAKETELMKYDRSIAPGVLP